MINLSTKAPQKIVITDGNSRPGLENAVRNVILFVDKVRDKPSKTEVDHRYKLALRFPVTWLKAENEVAFKRFLENFELPARISNKTSVWVRSMFSLKTRKVEAGSIVKPQSTGGSSGFAVFNDRYLDLILIDAPESQVDSELAAQAENELRNHIRIIMDYFITQVTTEAALAERHEIDFTAK